VNAVCDSAVWQALGTRASVLVTEAEALEDAQSIVAHELDEIDVACSRFRPDSELTRVNRSAGSWTPVGPLFLEALDAALRAARATEGDVDPTVGRLLRLAGYDRDFAEVVLRTGSVAAATCVDANTASTAAIVRGGSAPRWLASAGLPARLVRRDGSVLRVAGWPEPR
jgi:thiamine biosynthesis lipoprotein